ncbi:hypothetical protein OK016_20425 [Vibrio chagasii]|nr:hypothetical protein [Vibrio chagasii]
MGSVAQVMSVAQTRMGGKDSIIWYSALTMLGPGAGLTKGRWAFPARMISLGKDNDCVITSSKKERRRFW